MKKHKISNILYNRPVFAQLSVNMGRSVFSRNFDFRLILVRKKQAICVFLVTFK